MLTIRQVAETTKALQIEMDYGYIEIPPREEVKGSPLREWWFYAEDEGEVEIIAGDNVQPTPMIGAASMEQEAALLKALNEGDLKQLKAIIRQGVDPNIALTHGLTPLHFAAEQPDGGKMLRYLLDQGTDINTKGSLGGMTPLMNAVRAVQPENVRILLEAGSDVKTSAMGGLDALNACPTPTLGSKKVKMLQNSVLKIASMLIEAGVDVDQQTSYGASPLHHAVALESIPILQLLFDAGAEVNLPFNKASSLVKPLLSSAVETNNYQIVEFLLHAGADPSLQDNEGNTAFVEAMIQKRLDMVELLWKFNPPTTSYDKGSTTMLAQAIIENVPEVVTFLLDQGEDANSPQGEYPYSPLMWASIYGSDLEIIESLIARGADPNANDQAGRTALILARINRNDAIADWFRTSYPEM